MNAPVFKKPELKKPAFNQPVTKSPSLGIETDQTDGVGKAMMSQTAYEQSLEICRRIESSLARVGLGHLSCQPDGLEFIVAGRVDSEATRCLVAPVAQVVAGPRKVRVTVSVADLTR